jgi:ABC-type Na+ efflux pump permease subunit
MITWVLAGKDLRLLMRDRRALVILLVMPLIFILVLGLSLGEGFGQKPDDRLRVSLVDLDQGYAEPPNLRTVREAVAGLVGLPGTGSPLAAATLSQAAGSPLPEPWSKVVQRDLKQTAGIRLEIVPDLETAKALVHDRKRAAILVFGPDFSQRVNRSSFLTDGLNPLHRDGVNLDVLDASFLRDETQEAASAIIEQVAQVTLLRVVLPWMIGRAFDRLSDPDFIEILGTQVRLPIPGVARFVLRGDPDDPEGKIKLGRLLAIASANDPAAAQEYNGAVGRGVQDALAQQFMKYNLRGKTWASLTKSTDTGAADVGSQAYVDEGGSGLLKRGAYRYQVLVPSYTVMFAFFLVLTVGWLFVAERRQGTLRRLRAAPLSRTQILCGKMVPCFVVSLVQGLSLLLAGKLVFGMNWGPEPWLLLPVVFCTSLAAMGLALMVAALSRTETQVAIYGTLLVLVLGGVSGCLMPRSLMPEEMKQISRITPHAWALDAYAELLITTQPNLAIVTTACLVLTGFGLGFVAISWWVLDLEAA